MLLQMHLKLVVSQFVLLMLPKAAVVAQLGMSLRLCALAAEMQKTTASRDVKW